MNDDDYCIDDDDDEDDDDDDRGRNHRSGSDGTLCDDRAVKEQSSKQAKRTKSVSL